MTAHRTCSDEVLVQVYFKTWTGTAHGVPPTAGGGGYGEVRDVIVRNVHLDRVNIPLHLYQTNNGKTGDVPSQIQFSNLTFENWSGTANTNKSTWKRVACRSAGINDVS